MTATTFVTPYIKPLGLSLCDLREDKRRAALALAEYHAELAAESGYLGLYRSPEDGGEYDYVRNQRQTLERHLCEALGGELHVHKNGAFLVLEDADSFGETYPGRNPRRAQIDIILLLCNSIRDKVGAEYSREADDTVKLTRAQFMEEFLACRRKWAEGWGGIFDTWRWTAGAKGKEYGILWLLYRTDSTLKGVFPACKRTLLPAFLCQRTIYAYFKAVLKFKY